jgi:hypothetical protein
MKKLLPLLCLLLVAIFGYSQVITPIATIQQVSSANLAAGNDISSIDGDTVWIEGVCNFDPCLYAQSGSQGYAQRLSTFIMDNAGGWNGVQIMLDPGAVGMSTVQDSVKSLELAVDFINNFQPGNKVKCQGIVSNFNGNTQFLLIKVQSVITGSAALPVPTIVTIDSLEKLNNVTSLQDIQLVSGEKYEGTFVKILNPIVTAVSTTTPNRYRWKIKDAMGNELEIQDNFSGHFTNTAYDKYCSVGGSTTVTPTPYAGYSNGTVLTYVQGMILQNLNTTTQTKYFTIAPLLLSDVGIPTYAPPVISNVNALPNNPTASQTVSVLADAVDDSSLVSVKVYYAFGLNTTPIVANVAMSLQSGVTYQGTIPATVTDSTWVKYYIEATDNGGHITYYPDQNATNNYYLAINSGINHIADLQGRKFSNGKSIYAGDSIVSMTVSGIVTSCNQADDLGQFTIQNGTLPYSGIFLNGTTTSGLKRGMNITITAGKVNEILGANLNSPFGATTISNPTYVINSYGNTLPLPITTFNIDTAIANIHAKNEQWEAMLMGVNNVAVRDTNPDFVNGSNFGEFSIYPTGITVPLGLRCDDVSNDILFGFNTDSLTPNMNLCFLNGIMVYAFGNWKLYPRNLEDICGFNTNYLKQINSFVINTSAGTINQTANTISIIMPAGTNVTSLTPSIAFDGVNVSPAIGSAQNFTSPVTYTVSAADGSTKVYNVTVTVAAATKQISSFIINSTPGTINQTNLTIDLLLPAGTNVTALIPTIVHNGTTISPGNGAAQDFTNPVSYTVTASDATTAIYTVTVSLVNGIQSISNKNDINIYPNPSNKVVTIHYLAETASNGQLVIKNILGQIVYSQNLLILNKDQKIDINTAAFTNGEYFVEVITISQKAFKLKAFFYLAYFICIDWLIA